MKEFLKDIVNKQSELDGDVFDMLVSFTDFISFKEMFLDYKAAKDGCTPDLSIDCSKAINASKIYFCYVFIILCIYNLFD
ncbi:ADP-ribosylation factor-like protein 2-binding protein [Caerostris extrusa]|uniref:ADP-ribosylation factor-like protein 2-binding protein n=1 Tax=Caerostris extrusa TaxID=172846 RepID=A0AAV4T757_CAEEX|nr:ADP-ribosylation factor-like protein 2-binding protein [Caerostris extrusa]